MSEFENKMNKMRFGENQPKPSLHNDVGRFNPPTGPNPTQPTKPFGENDFVKTDEKGNRFVPVGNGPKQAKQMFHPMAKISNVRKNEQGEFTYDLDPDGLGKNISTYVYGPGGQYHYNKTLRDKVFAQNQQMMKEGRWRG